MKDFIVVSTVLTKPHNIAMPTCPSSLLFFVYDRSYFHEQDQSSRRYFMSAYLKLDE